ncbi:GIY-YIG nuclease family protein [Nocardia miyunensis]|uniref:GIY-YIG nuclease family protein n=1 Tax=Nocardia miyunensis TaxID=282684 RepID=UPI00082D3BA1|nr:GIY-YIG nuclease family protein [Nocardia miyunensis]
MQIGRSSPEGSTDAKELTTVGYIYAFRLGALEKFKIGQTTMTPEKRRSSLQTSCDQPLKLFDAIETDEHKALELHIKDVWGHRRSTEGGTEIYHLTETEAAQLFSDCRTWVTEDLPKQRRTEELEAIEPDPTELPSDEQTRELRSQWIKLHDEEIRAKQEFDRAVAARARVETELKLTIGTAAGIEGVATWETDVKSRRISPDLVQAREPELFELSLVPTLNAKKFEALLKGLGREGEYESFQEIRYTRKFKIAE